VAQALKISPSSPEKWYSISNADLTGFTYGTQAIRKSQLVPTLRVMYKDCHWDVHRLTEDPQKIQDRQWYSRFQALFPYNKVESQFHHSEIGELELDICVKGLALAFENQGDHHYAQVKFYAKNQDENEQKKVDNLKNLRCAQVGWTLIHITPWIQTPDVFLQIKNIRPDIDLK